MAAVTAQGVALTWSAVANTDDYLVERAPAGSDAFQSVATVATPHEITYRGGKVDGRVATRDVGDVSEVFVRYGANVLVEATPTAERFVLTVPLGPMGAGVTRIASTRTSAFVLASGSRTLMHPDGRAGALVYSLRTDRLGRHLEGLLGR